MDQLAEAGVVSEENGTKPREILMSIEQFEEYVDEI
jgi:S-DNA-T family DNA segregation ATPase FtsK/SpoIIIE